MLIDLQTFTFIGKPVSQSLWSRSAFRIIIIGIKKFWVENDRPEKISNKKDQPCWLGKSSLTQGLKVSILSWNLQTQSGRFEVEGEMGCLGKGFGNFLNLTNTKTKTNTNTLYLGSCDNCLHAILFWKWIIFRKKSLWWKTRLTF